MLHSTEPQPGLGPRRCMEWRCVPREQVTSLRDAHAVQHWFPEWKTWPLSRRRLWGLDTPMHNKLLAAPQGLLHISVMPSTVLRKACM